MEFFTADDGAKIAYRDTGKGLPLLCLSGLTRNTDDFDYVAPHLTDVRMICMDYRGRGQSEWTGADSYTVMREGADALQLLDHLGLHQAAILGTSRGGLIGMGLGAMAPDRIMGLCMNDVGPVLVREGIERIFDYVGRNPGGKTYEDLAAGMARHIPGFDNMPDGRWLTEARKHYIQTPDGMKINYDPALRDSFLKDYEAEAPDLWPFFDMLKGRPVAVIRGGNSDLLSEETVAEMKRRIPDLITATVPDRAHIPFLDEPAALHAVRAFIDALR